MFDEIPRDEKEHVSPIEMKEEEAPHETRERDEPDDAQARFLPIPLGHQNPTPKDQSMLYCYSAIRARCMPWSHIQAPSTATSSEVRQSEICIRNSISSYDRNKLEHQRNWLT